MLTKDDVGPKEHVRNILKYSSFNIDVVTTYKDDIWNKFLKKCIKSKYKNTMLNIFMFQVLVGIFIVKNRKRYDAVLVRQSVGFFLIPIISKILNIKIMVEVNGFQYQDLIDRGKVRLAKINKFLEKITFRCSNKIVCVHENIKYNLMSSFKSLKNEEHKIVVVENGIETTDYINAQESKDKHNISQSQFRIGYLGSYAYREGVDFLPEIAQKIKDVNIKFVLIGGTKKEVEKFQKIINKKNVREKFELTPYLPLSEAIDRLKSCDICIHLRRPISGSTNSQGSPLKMLDYHNIGRYVIASDIDSYKYIKQNNYGELVDLSKRNVLENIVNLIQKLKQDEYIVGNGKLAYDFIQHKTWKNQIKKLDFELDNI